MDEQQTAGLIDQPVLVEADCLRIINEGRDEFGEISAYSLLDIKMGPAIERRFKAIDKKLIELIRDVRVVFPDAEFYTASGGFSLLLGSSHNEKATKGQAELSALSGNAQIGDGDY